MKQISNADFFKKKFVAGDIQKKAPAEKPAGEKVKVAKKFTHEKLRVSDELFTTMKQLETVFNANGLTSSAEKIADIYKQAIRERFSVAVVGEFSKGKSTFINRLLSRDFLAVADLPSTAMLTRIRYNTAEKMIVLNESGKRVKALSVGQSSWEGLTADNINGKDPKGTVLIGLADEWLGENNIEIIDTPGAGDLEASRAQVIGDALLGCDGAIITISATQAMSLSEKLFIEQRLITRTSKVPYVMLIVTKLDTLPLKERTRIIDFVHKKIISWNMDIPVYVPYEVELPDDKYKDIVGLDKVKAAVAGWANDPQRKKMTEEWVAGRINDTIESALTLLNEQVLLQQADDEKRKELIEKKKQLLEKAKLAWADLRIKLLERANDCNNLLIEKTDEYKISVTERLQYEASHSNDPQKWWTNDYPYRLKIELSNMAVGIENAVSRRIAEDAKWFNAALESNFKSHVLFESTKITEKTSFDSAQIKELEFEDLKKQRNMTRIGTTALSFALYPLCVSAGFLPLVATMGVSTGANIISEKFFGQKVENQREMVKQAVASGVPEIIDEATAESEKRLRALYNDICCAAVEKEKEWFETHKAAIEKSAAGKASGDSEKLQSLIKTISDYTIST